MDALRSPIIAHLEERRQAVSTAELALEAEPIDSGWMAWAGPGSWANQACGLGLGGPVSDGDLDRLVDFYLARGAEPRLEVCAYAHPSLLEGLARRGFVLREFESVLARAAPVDLDPAALLVHGWPEGLQLVEVDPGDAEAVKTFIDVSTSGFRPAGEPITEVFFNTTLKMVEHPRCDSVLALVDGEVVGGAAMESAGEVGCLFGASVLPDFRRRGIQAALIAWRLCRGARRGCRWIAIHAAPGLPTERNALRLGFFLAYTKVVMTLPRPDLTPST